MAAKAAPSALVVATRAADGGCGAGYGHSKVDTANAALRGQKLGTSTEVGPAEHFELSSDDGRPTGLPLGKLQRHAGIGYEIVQSLDVLVLQMVEQLSNEFFAAHLPVVAEPVIEVSKILLDRVPQRIVERRPPQMAEQLVEVPTEPGCALAVFASLLSGQGSTASESGFSEQVVDNPVPQGRRGEQIVEIQARRGLQGPGQGSTASSSSRLLDDAEKCEVGSALGVGTVCRLYSVHAGSLCGLRWAADVGR